MILSEEIEMRKEKQEYERHKVPSKNKIKLQDIVK